jgi:hypothetical protein
MTLENDYFCYDNRQPFNHVVRTTHASPLRAVFVDGDAPRKVGVTFEIGFHYVLEDR